jgi:hypothetical protein
LLPDVYTHIRSFRQKIVVAIEQKMFHAFSGDLLPFNPGECKIHPVEVFSVINSFSVLLKGLNLAITTFK